MKLVYVNLARVAIAHTQLHPLPPAVITKPPSLVKVAIHFPCIPIRFASISRRSRSYRPSRSQSHGQWSPSWTAIHDEPSLRLAP